MMIFSRMLGLIFLFLPHLLVIASNMHRSSPCNEASMTCESCTAIVGGKFRPTLSRDQTTFSGCQWNGQVSGKKRCRMVVKDHIYPGYTTMCASGNPSQQKKENRERDKEEETPFHATQVAYPPTFEIPAGTQLYHGRNVDTNTEKVEQFHPDPNREMFFGVTPIGVCVLSNRYENPGQGRLFVYTVTETLRVANMDATEPTCRVKDFVCKNAFATGLSARCNINPPPVNQCQSNFRAADGGFDTARKIIEMLTGEPVVQFMGENLVKALCNTGQYDGYKWTGKEREIALCGNAASLKLQRTDILKDNVPWELEKKLQDDLTNELAEKIVNENTATENLNIYQLKSMLMYFGVIKPKGVGETKEEKKADLIAKVEKFRSTGTFKNKII